MSKVCIVRPPMIDLRYRATTVTCPPIGMAYVAGAAQAAGHDVHVIDAVGEAPEQTTPLDDGRYLVRGLNAEQIVERLPLDTDVLALSCMFSQDWPYMKGILRALRARLPHVPVVAGGEHITAMPEFVIQDGIVQHCVLGEGEETFVDLLAALASGRSTREVPGLVTLVDGEIVRTGPRARIADDVNEVPPPAWDLFPIEQYLAGGYGFGVNRGRSMPILATRGCPYRCTFCSSPQMWTTRWVAREPAAVLEEMRGYIERYGAQNFDFYDLTAIIKREWIVTFCRLALQSGLRFTWQLPTGTRSEAIDEQVADLLYRTGCRNITYAPESGSPSELARIKKKVRLDNMKKSMRACTRRGINVKSNIVLGFPGQTKREILETMGFLVSMAMLGVRDTMVSLFCPYPGSEMYRNLRAAGKIGEPTDDYFTSLACYTDLSKGGSWTEHVTGRQLGLARVVGQLLFYVASYAVRPWRAVQTAYHIVARRHESPLERTVTDLLGRFGTAIGERARSGRRARLLTGAGAADPPAAGPG